MNTKKTNPIIKSIYTADPAPMVVGDTLYLYTTHDEDELINDFYTMVEWCCFSTKDMVNWTDHGVIFSLDDIEWADDRAWAPQAVERNGKFYLYCPVHKKDGGMAIAVGVSENPTGPFKDLGEPLVDEGDWNDIDPTVFIDDDGKAYLYFGGLWGGQLEKWQTGEFIADAVGPAGDEPALGPIVAELSDDLLSFKSKPQEIKILDENGLPLKAGDEERRYFEGPWIHKYNGYYYLSYSTGSTHYLVYAISKDPKGPFIYQGKILEPVIGWTTHHSIVEFKDKWYLFYHDSSLSGGVNHKRCVKYTELKYGEDGKIITMDPYADEFD